MSHEEALALTQAEIAAWGIRSSNLHAMPIARLWVVWLLPPEGEPFKTRIEVPAGYLGHGENAAIADHCARFYPDHGIAEAWPAN